MSTSELRENIHLLVEKADRGLLMQIHDIIQLSTEPTAPEWFYEELQQRRNKHLKGQSKSYSWEQVRTSINDL